MKLPLPCLLVQLATGLIGAGAADQKNPVLNLSSACVDELASQERSYTLVEEASVHRLAWLEYLANVYIEADDFDNARNTMSRLWWWTSQPVSLKAVAEAMQRLETFMAQRVTHLRTLSESHHPEFITIWNLIMGIQCNVKFSQEHPILVASDGPEKTRIHQALAVENWGEAVNLFSSLVDRTTYSKTRLVVSIVALDKSDRHGCVSLWDRDWQLDRRVKQFIVDSYNQIHVRDLDSGLFSALPLGPQIKVRLLARANFPSISDQIEKLEFPSRQLIEACWHQRNGSSPKDGRDKARPLYQQVMASSGEPIWLHAKSLLNLLDVQEKMCPSESGVPSPTVALTMPLDMVVLPCDALLNAKMIPLHLF